MQGSQLLLSGLQYPNRKLFISRVGSCLSFSVPESGAGKHASHMADQQESQDLPAMETTLVARLLHWLLSLYHVPIRCEACRLTAKEATCIVRNKDVNGIQLSGRVARDSFLSQRPH